MADDITPRPTGLSPASLRAIAGAAIALACLVALAIPLRHVMDQSLPACTSHRVSEASHAYARDFGVASPRLTDFRQVGEAHDRRDCTATVTNAAGGTAEIFIQVFRDAEGRSRVGALPPSFQR